jgi:hypothetical protein
MMKNLITVLACIVLIVFGYREIREIERESTPITRWLEVKSVTVHPTIEGRTPVMTVERAIHREFVGEWSATVRRSTPEGFQIACSATGSTDYLPGARLPTQLDLDWWTFPVRCNLKAGTYRVDTTWTVRVPGYPDKFLVVRSNLFEVAAAASQ